MPVTIGAAALAAAMRTEESEQVTRLLAYGAQAATKYAPDAPDVVLNEAVIRIAAYLYDAPNSSMGAYSRVLHNCGAADMLAPYRSHRAGKCEVSDA